MIRCNRVIGAVCGVGRVVLVYAIGGGGWRAASLSLRPLRSHRFCSGIAYNAIEYRTHSGRPIPAQNRESPVVGIHLESVLRIQDLAARATATRERTVARPASAPSKDWVGLAFRRFCTICVNAPSSLGLFVKILSRASARSWPMSIRRIQQRQPRLGSEEDERCRGLHFGSLASFRSLVLVTRPHRIQLWSMRHFPMQSLRYSSVLVDDPCWPPWDADPSDGLAEAPHAPRFVRDPDSRLFSSFLYFSPIFSEEDGPHAPIYRRRASAPGSH